MVFDIKPSDVSQACGVSPQMIRVWRERGAIDGLGYKQENGQWLYSEECVQKFRLIGALSSFGLRCKHARALCDIGRAQQVLDILVAAHGGE